MDGAPSPTSTSIPSQHIDIPLTRQPPPASSHLVSTAPPTVSSKRRQWPSNESLLSQREQLIWDEIQDLRIKLEADGARHDEELVRNKEFIVPNQEFLDRSKRDQVHNTRRLDDLEARIRKIEEYVERFTRLLGEVGLNFEPGAGPGTLEGIVRAAMHLSADRSGSRVQSR
ncbi:hypothetical protein BDK51DRAFT_44363 [Blyttiomyces helicus]|uniref:Uncharacterized protein n=1 Tax=Blyttiomyces helicus TaxID=388810 RepID=A0A4P9W6I0_9FUNG|nr:hypothetical protein BDK51DRAFT_44363 [Blyttiomyces helicus]|eukprot:RKO86973.1 hypothetical protein BDK51DRAFT_44363 [Blyttiomyces helicus]